MYWSRVVFVMVAATVPLAALFFMKQPVEKNDPQYDALVDLYRDTAGESWTKKTGWELYMIDRDYCGGKVANAWYGVYCNSDGTLQYLLLGDNNLVGNLNNSIGNLVNLTSLDLSQNQLVGTIPIGITGLANIESLSLEQNQLSGQIPDGLLSIGSLRNVKLGMNNFSGTLPYLSGQEIVNLASVDMSYNQIGGTIPAYNFPDLEILDLSNNQLSGTLHTAFIAQSIQLSTLDLSNNSLSGTLPAALGQLQELSMINLAWNNFSGPIPGMEAQASTLFNVDISNNPNLNGQLPNWLGCSKTISCNAEGDMGLLCNLTCFSNRCNLQACESCNLGYCTASSQCVSSGGGCPVCDVATHKCVAAPPPPPPALPPPLPPPPPITPSPPNPPVTSVPISTGSGMTGGNSGQSSSASLSSSTTSMTTSAPLASTSSGTGMPSPPDRAFAYELGAGVIGLVVVVILVWCIWFYSTRRSMEEQRQLSLLGARRNVTKYSAVVNADAMDNQWMAYTVPAQDEEPDPLAEGESAIPAPAEGGEEVLAAVDVKIAAPLRADEKTTVSLLLSDQDDMNVAGTPRGTPKMPMPEGTPMSPNKAAEVAAKKKKQRRQYTFQIDSQLEIIKWSELTIIGEIGRGGFGVVLQARRGHTDLAVKVLRNIVSPRQVQAFVEEASVLSEIKHPNCVLCMGVCVEADHMSIVTEFMAGGDLHQFVYGNDEVHVNAMAASAQDDPRHWLKTLKILFDAALGLEYLHRRDIPHRDLKLRNILLDNRTPQSAKLADFGMSGFKKTAVAGGGTLAYAPPEVTSGGAADKRSDIYSLGIVIYEALSRHKPDLNSVEDPVPRDWPPTLNSLLHDCWRADPEARPSVSKVLEVLDKLMKLLNQLLESLDAGPTPEASGLGKKPELMSPRPEIPRPAFEMLPTDSPSRESPFFAQPASLPLPNNTSPKKLGKSAPKREVVGSPSKRRRQPEDVSGPYVQPALSKSAPKEPAERR